MNQEVHTSVNALNQEQYIHPELKQTEKRNYIHRNILPNNGPHMLPLPTPVPYFEDPSSTMRPHQRTSMQCGQPNFENNSQLSVTYSTNVHHTPFLGPPSILLNHPQSLLVQPIIVRPLDSTYSHLQPPSPPPEVLTLPQDDFQYYEEIKCFLSYGEYPKGTSEAYRSRLNKKAQHYQVINGELYHNKKSPKRVVMMKDEQQKMLREVHINKVTGVHLGVKKMYSIIQTDAFWRGMYLDTVNLVKQCAQCSEKYELGNQSSQKNIDTLPPCEKITQTTSAVWKKLEIEVHGPYPKTINENDLIFTLSDPVSKFVIGSVGKQNTSLDSSVTHLVSAISILGLADLTLITSPNIRLDLESELKGQLSRIFNISQLAIIKSETRECSWLSQLLNLLVSSKPDRWDLDLERYLMEWRVEHRGGVSSPFSALFGRRFHQIENDQVSTESLESRMKEKINVSNDIQYEDDLKKKNEAQKENVPLEQTELKVSDQEMENNVADVKDILSETKVYRSKRGKYHKYSPEMQELMVELAMKKGSRKASQFFSRKLQTRVSESTIRNLIKSHLHLHSQLKDEIAEYAYKFGAEKACRYYSNRIQKDIPINSVRKLLAIYINRLKNNWNKQKSSLRSGPSIDTLSEKVKHEIGFYASCHSLEETVNHFMERGIELDVDLVISVVKYLESKRTPPNLNSQIRVCNNPFISNSDNSVLESQSNELDYYPEAETTYQNDQYSSEHKNTEESVPCLSGEISNDPSVNQINTAENSQLSCGNTNKSSSKKRGQYSSYSPELRAEIGKFAAIHGPLKASNHFSHLLGRNIPESTARGLRDKYVKKSKFIPVTSLGFCQRGRPLRLGKYDELVQDCLRELIRSGEKVTTYLAIVTARSILNKYEPSLLKENGGSVVLNVTWAKSFLKRIGVRNNS